MDIDVGMSAHKFHSHLPCIFLYTFLIAVMKVKFAYYGVSCANGVLKQDTIKRTTNWVGSLCNGRSSCSGVVHTSILTDPYGGCRKDFLAVAECSGGRVITTLLKPEAQGQAFHLACN